MQLRDASFDLAAFAPDQRAAIAADGGSLLVNAGPGTGKTTTLVARLAHLACQEHLEAERALVLVFNRSAQLAVRTRLLRVLGEYGDSVRCHTFHAFGWTLVERYAPRLGYRHPPRIVTPTDDAWISLLRGALGQGDDALPRRERDWARTRRRLELARNALALYERPEGDGRVAPSLPLARRFEGLLRSRGLVDPTGLLTLPLHLARSDPRLVRGWRGSLDLILADEFQDTSSAHMGLVRTLVGAGAAPLPLTALGDPRQSIYRFNGALTEHTVGFRRYFPGGRELHLRQSFRASGALLETVNAVGALFPRRLGEELWSDKLAGPRPYLVACADPDDEAAFVAGEVARLRDLGIPPSAIAVLGRTNGAVRGVAARLAGEGVPVASRDGGAGVWAGTIHRAKGGEWRFVFGVGLEDGTIPGRAAAAAFARGDREGEEEVLDDLHATYVLVSRASQALYLSFVRRRYREWEPAPLSRFLAAPAVLATCQPYPGREPPDDALVAGPLPGMPAPDAPGPLIDLEALAARVRAA